MEFHMYYNFEGFQKLLMSESFCRLLQPSAGFCKFLYILQISTKYELLESSETNLINLNIQSVVALHV